MFLLVGKEGIGIRVNPFRGIVFLGIDREGIRRFEGVGWLVINVI